MYELWLLSFFYRIVKGIIAFVSRNWIFFLAGIVLCFLCGIAVGSFFISLFAFLNHRNQPDQFDTKAGVSLLLQIFGFFCLSSDFFKEFPFLFKATAIGNAAGLLMTALYVARFVCDQRQIYQRLQRWLYAGISVAVTCFILIVFNSFTHVTVYAMAKGNEFPGLLQQEKRDKYRNDFETLKATHYKLSKHDYYHHDRLQQTYLQRYNNGQDEGEDTLVILNFTHLFRLLYYTYGDDGSYEDVVEKPLLDGFDATFSEGALQYNRDSVFTNSDTFYFDQARYAGHPIYEETDIELEVLPQTLDDYIAYRESSINLGERNMYVSLDYLESKGIPVRLEEYPKKKQMLLVAG